jgi:hypothetical protein
MLATALMLVVGSTAYAAGLAFSPPIEPPQRAAPTDVFSGLPEPRASPVPIALLAGEAARRKVAEELWGAFDAGTQYEYHLDATSLEDQQVVSGRDGIGRAFVLECTMAIELPGLPADWEGTRTWLVYGAMSTDNGMVAVGGWWFLNGNLERFHLTTTFADVDQGVLVLARIAEFQVRTTSGCMFADAQYELDQQAIRDSANACVAQCRNTMMGGGIACAIGAGIACSGCIAAPPLAPILCPGCVAGIECMGWTIGNGFAHLANVGEEYDRVMECACLAAEARGKGLIPPNCPPFKCPCN